MITMVQRLCVLGDSIAKGVVFDCLRNRYSVSKDCFAAQIGQKLGSAVINLSKFGSTVADGEHRFEKERDALADCSAVIMNFGGNDSDFLWQEIAKDPDAQHEPKTGLKEFEDTYLSLIDEVKESGKTPVLLDLPPVDHARYFAWISRNLNSDNILKWLGGSSEFIYRWHEQYSIAVQKIAQAANVRLIDIRSAFLRVRDFSSLLCNDGIHPNEAGHRLIANEIMLQA